MIDAVPSEYTRYSFEGVFIDEIIFTAHNVRGDLDMYFQSLMLDGELREYNISVPALWPTWNCGGLEESGECGAVESGMLFWEENYVLKIAPRKEEGNLCKNAIFQLKSSTNF